MSPSSDKLLISFVKITIMQKFISKLDFTLIFRLSLSAVMLVAAFRQSDYVSGGFGLFLAFYAIVGVKYKVGCGYNNCSYSPRHYSKYIKKEQLKQDML
jgi:hypothetical protein